MNTISELFAAAGSTRPPTADTLMAAKTFMRRMVSEKDHPQKRFGLAYNSFLNMHVARLLDDDVLFRKSFNDLRAALAEQQSPASSQPH